MAEQEESRSKQTPTVAVDNCIFTVMEDRLRILLIQMKKKPFTGRWALPGELIGNRESLDAAAARVLREQTGVSDVYLEQLYTFGRPERDPLRRVVSVAYISLIHPSGLSLQTTAKYAAVRWWRVSAAPHLAYDHKEILSYARQRLKWKVQYTNVIWSLVPRKFTLSKLQRAYEAILDRELDKRNFRKKILSLGLIEPLGEKQTGGAHRPAMLYRFKSRKPRLVEVL